LLEFGVEKLEDASILGMPYGYQLVGIVDNQRSSDIDVCVRYDIYEDEYTIADGQIMEFDVRAGDKRKITEPLFQGGNRVELLDFRFMALGAMEYMACPSDKLVKTEPTLPPPSSIKDDTKTVLTITAEELVKGITRNSAQKNIKEYFAKYADITGVVVQVEKGFKTNNYEVLLDGNNGGAELAFVMCKIFDYDQAEIDKISPGQTVTVHGQIKAMKEVPTNSALLSSWTEKNFRGQVIKPCEIKK
tara:strand:+ start:68 stop:805 length:738 start_codon:yes stop_codon:yes gene_type:complete